MLRVRRANFCSGRRTISDRGISSDVMLSTLRTKRASKRERERERELLLSSMNLKRNEHNGALTSLAEPSRCAGRIERRPSFEIMFSVTGGICGRELALERNALDPV